MKIHSLLFTLLLGSTVPVFAQIQNDEMANRIVTSVANVKAGEMVLIEGGKEQIEFMEALAEQIHNKGAYPKIILESERAGKAGMSKVPEAHLVAHHNAAHKLDNKADLTIYVSSNIDYNSIQQQIPQDYAEKRRKAIDEAHKGQDEDLPTPKYVSVGLPTETEAKTNGIDYDIYKKMIYEAIGADYAAMALKGKQLAAIFKAGKKVHLTTAAGTNLTFDLAGRPGSVNDGVISEEDSKSSLKADRLISLPAGDLTVSVIENSANGKLVVPKDRQYSPNGEVTIKNATYELKNGKIVNLKAETNQALMEKRLKDADPMLNLFAGINIGLNAALKVVSDEKHDFRPASAQGHVTLYMGNSDWLGGTNKVKDSFAIPIENATVSIDGKVVVKNGKLTLDKLTSN